MGAVAHPAPRRAAAGLAACSLAALALAVAPQVAHADATTAKTLAVAGNLDASGALHVTETLTFDGTAPAKLTQRLATTSALPRARQRVYTISDVTAKVGSTAASPSTSNDSDATTISVDTANAGSQPVTIGYTVTGATLREGGSTVLDWPLLQGLSVGASQVSGSVHPPKGTTFVDCVSGQPGSLTPCRAFGAGTFDSPDPSFQDGARAANDELVLRFGVPASSVKATDKVKQLWSLDNAFKADGSHLLWALLPLLLGALALWALHRRAGTDQAGRGAAAPVGVFDPVGEGRARFRVLEGVRPGEVGTVADERVDPVDVSATLLDLAVRGHLLIIEQPRTSPHAPLDWVFERRENPSDQLLDYERVLLDTVAPAGRHVAVSQLGSTVREAIPDVQSKLYDEVVRRGWFARRPDATRDQWSLIGWVALVVALVAAGALIAFSSFGLLGLALVLIALGLMYVAQRMPRRTASGSALLRGLHALASQLQVQPTNQAPTGEEYSEPARVLPYAVVLGGADRWLKAIADADNDPGVPDPTDLDWYHAPATWHLSDLPASIESFIVTVQGQLYRR